MWRNLLIIIGLALLTGCSVVQATSGPESKDLSVLNKGTERYQVLAELGQPVVTEVDADGRKYDIFKFMQGQNGGVKAGKAVLYGTAAVFTLGLSEVITSPLEGAAGKGAEIKTRVIYDANLKVDEVEVLQDDRWLPVQDLGNSAKG
jgi:outer membrane protein assembly factor BamE (lipoprotein component of BamABCDE complex)